jgi:hypothetical protein
MIDLEALEWRIAEKADKGIHVAPIVRELIAELKEARKGAEKERAAVVAWLREYEGHSSLASLFALMADTVERGDHIPKGDA